LKVGEKVFIEDLIEDILGSTWNQGDCYRLASSEAVWNGKTFQVVPQSKERLQFIG